MFYKVPVFGAEHKHVIVEADTEEEAALAYIPAQLGDRHTAEGLRYTKFVVVQDELFENCPILYKNGNFG